ncbi:MAG: anti-sigma factor antagonist [Kofleriaceae bacterium]|nr:anti-sigma factor antagonist [Kofleriaceae bacterium]
MQPDTSTAATSAGAQSDATVGPSGAKLTVDKFADGDIVGLRFDGSIDANFEGKKLAASLTAATLILDLGGVKKISSFGIREWVDFVKTAGEQVQQLILIECTPKVVDQLNIVGNFAGHGRVFSFYAPFHCDYCDSEHRVLLHVDRDRDVIKSMKLPQSVSKL